MFLQQGGGQLPQPITELTAGQTYWFEFFFDARACCGGTIDLSVKWDDTVLDTSTNVQPSYSGAPHKFKSVPFTPS